MSSYKNHEFRYNQPKGGPKVANDITIVFRSQVKIIGVDGVSPDDPKAEYDLDGDNSQNIKIRDIKKEDDEKIIIRVKGPGRGTPNITKAYWTKDGKRIPKALSLLAADDIDAELDPVAIALDTVEPLREEIKNLSRCLEILISTGSIEKIN
jgi:hypothetical protein